MATVVSGTFTGTGQSAENVGREFVIAMNFAGAASVDIEMRAPDNNWIKLPNEGTAITADTALVAEFPVAVALRLNCTAYTDNVAYSLSSIG